MSLPERIASLNHLLQLQKMKPELLVVLYPPHGKAVISGRQWNEPQYYQFPYLRNRLVQTEPGLLDRWQVGNSQDFVRSALNRGYHGLCLDLFHFRREPSQGFIAKFEPWQISLPILLSSAKMIHLRINSPVEEFTSEFSSQNELADVLSGGTQSELGQILQAIKTSNWSGPIVTEIPFNTASKVIKPKSFMMSPREYVNAHRDILDAVRALLD